MTAYANVDGETLLQATLHVPNFGPWWADVVFEGAPEVSGSVTLEIGELSLTGTIRPLADGTFGEQRRSRIVAGAGGWGQLVGAQHYHDDNSVTARSVAEDAARAVGETIGTFTVDEDSLGIDYVRESGLASRILEDAIANTPWHVDFDGNTNVGERSTSEANSDQYQVLEFNPKSQIAVLAVDDLSAINVGSIISEGLDESETIHEMRIKVSLDAVRIFAWVGGSLISRGKLAEFLVSVIKRATDNRRFGKTRYRVLRMATDRVELQIVEQASGLPDAIPLSMQPGVAGAHAKLTSGSIVLVEFVEGKRTMPIITAFAGKDTQGHAADELDLTVTTKLRLGNDTATDAVALAPTIDSQFDDLNLALDAFVLAVPVPNDGGVALQTAVKGVWGTGVPPKPASSVGATLVDAK